MKRLVILSLAFITVCSSFTCTKKYCWKCMTRVTVDNQQSEQRNTICDKTEKEIREYEKQASYTQTSGGTTIKAYTVCGK